MERLRQAEVEHLHGPVRLHLHVGRFQIAVDDPLFVGSFECLGDLAGDGEGLVERDWSILHRSRGPTPTSCAHLGCARPAGRRRSPDQFLQRRTLDVFEDQGGGVAFVFEAVDRRDVRVVQRRQHLRFPLEAGQPLGVVDEGVGEDLQRDIAVELGVAGLVHLAHAAYPELFADNVLPEPGTRRQRHENLPRCLTAEGPAPIWAVTS